MKQLRKTAITILLAVGIICAFAQGLSSGRSGLYKNEDDFILHKLTYSLDCNSAQRSINTHSFLESPRITVTIEDKKYVVLKKDFFGYRDCKGRDFRFYQSRMFEILDTAGFYLYRHTALEPGAGGKGYTTVTRYYFSKKGDETIHGLTVKELEDAYPENARFRYALEGYAQQNKGLLDYDSYAKVYKLKYLFNQSLK
jgi:hypothetical protein